MKKKIENKVKKILQDEFKIKKINSDTDLTNIRNWDSLKHLDFIMRLEKKFKVKFSLKENFNIKKVSTFVSVLNKKIK